MEIANTPATVPPAMTPVFELRVLCPPGPWIDVVELEELATVCDREAVVLVRTTSWEVEG